MTPLLNASTLGLLAEETPLENAAYGDYCIQGASVIVADAAGHPDWLGIGPTGLDIAVVPAPRRAVMIAEQLAKRSYLNPNAVVSEGSIGPIGGDRTVEEFARTFQLTTMEAAYLAELKRTSSVVPVPPALWTLEIEVRPYEPNWATVWLPDLDPMAKSWPVEDEEAYGWIYGPSV